MRGGIVIGNTPSQGLVLDKQKTPYDNTTVASNEISSMWFEITDVWGKLVETHGHSVSFSLIFQDDEG